MRRATTNGSKMSAGSSTVATAATRSRRRTRRWAKGKAGSGAAIGGLTGLFIGAIGGALGMLSRGTIGALTGGGVGAASESSFKPMVDSLEDALAPDASMLVLVGETDTLDAFVGAADAGADALIRNALTSEQPAELTRPGDGFSIPRAEVVRILHSR